VSCPETGRSQAGTVSNRLCDLFVLDQVQLEGSNVFDGRPFEWFIDQVGKSSHMVGVSIDGGVGEIANHHVFGESFGELTFSFSIRGHGLGSLRRCCVTLMIDERSS